MTTIKSYTDIEQSKKLAEILPLESADMYYYTVNGDLYKTPNVIESEDDLYVDEKSIPCWSLAALMNLLPSEFTEKCKYSTTTYKIDIRKYKFTSSVNLHQIAYGSYKWHGDGGYTWRDMINTGEKENLIDAVFQIICWLRENNKL